MSLMKLFVSTIYIFLAFTIKSQTIIYDLDAEKYMEKRFEAITSKLIDSAISGNLKIDTLEIKNIAINSKSKEISGIYHYSKNSYSSVILEEPFIINPKNATLVCRFSGDFIESDWSNLSSLKLGCVNIKNKTKTEVVLSSIGFNKFKNILSDNDKQLLNWFINYKSLYRKSITSSPCFLDITSIQDYGNYTVFNLNLRLRNFILNGRLNLYRNPEYIYSKDKEQYIIKTDSIENIWSNYILTQYTQYSADNNSRSTLVVQEDSDNKYFCLSPSIAYITSLNKNQYQPIYMGYVIYEDYKQYMSESEKYIIWEVYKSVYK